MITLPSFYYDEKTKSSQVEPLLKISNQYPHEISKPSWFEDVLVEIFNSVINYGNHLGYDIRSRLPDTSKIRLLSEEGYLTTGATMGEHNEIRGFNTPVYHEVLIKLPDEYISEDTDLKSKGIDYIHIFSPILHELVHLISYIKCTVNDENLTEYLQLGFYDTINNDLKCFNEGLTELSQFYIMKNFWKDNKKLAGFLDLDRKTMCVGYPLSTVLVSMLIENMSKKTDIPYKGILNRLQKSQIADPDLGKKFIAEVIGEEKTDLLSKLQIDEIENVNDYIKLTPVYQSLGLDAELEELNKDPGYKFVDRI